jgi:hypothetical protein
MLIRFSFLGLAATTLLAAGCGGSNNNSQGTPPTMSVNGPSTEDRTAFEAKTVVNEFLNALRRGDDAKAKGLLTKLARQKVEAQGRTLGRGANDGVKIEADDATFPTPEHDIAHVPTRWIDQDATGKQRTDKATFICRHEEEGWRVAGYAAYVFEGEDPVLMNFEDPEDMAKHEQLLEEEEARRSRPESTSRSTGQSSLEAEKHPKDAFQR